MREGAPGTVIRAGALLILGVVAGCKAAAAPSDVRGGKLVLAPAGGPRHLACEGEDVEPALDALARFLDAMPADKVDRPGPGRARLDIDRDVDLLWRVDGEGAKRLLRIAALPADPYEGDDRAIDLIGAIDRWLGLNGVSASAPSHSGNRVLDVAPVTRVWTPDAPLRTPIGDAAVEEFRGKGLDLVQEEVVCFSACLLARGPDRAILWSVFWFENGQWSVRHHADPFDSLGEQEALFGIFRRATGLEPTIPMDEVR